MNINHYAKLLGEYDINDHTSVSYTPPQVATAYSFPSKHVSSNLQGIILIELGGGYSPTDVTHYFNDLHLPVPSVTFVPISGARNVLDGPNGGQGEVMLDICVAGGVTGGSVPIYVVMAENTVTGFANAIKWAATSPNVPASVVSISWGAPESSWNSHALSLMDSAINSCISNHRSVFVASGDSGSSDGLSGLHVDYPASNPLVVSCGGTTLQLNGNETVWSGSGGGKSNSYTTPSFQNSLSSIVSGRRGIPDVSGVADPNTGWRVLINGTYYVFGGTSAVAPMWAGLTCLLNQNLGRNLGFYNTALYNAISSFKDITSGNNGGYTARVGYDLCTGNGSPNGSRLLTALR
jgi:kumamolisin